MKIIRIIYNIFLVISEQKKKTNNIINKKKDKKIKEMNFLNLLIPFLIQIYKTFQRGANDRNDQSVCAEHGLTDNKCVGTVTEYTDNGEVSTYSNYISMCKKKTDYCQTVTYANRDIGFCAKIIHQGRPKDKCKVEGDCYSGKCENHKCEGKSDGEYCISSLECGLRSACIYLDKTKTSSEDSRICAPLVGSGERCFYGSSSVQRRNPYYSPMFNFVSEREDNCFPGYVCTIVAPNLEKYNALKADDDNYKCISKFSVLDGQYVDYENYVACQSGYMKLDETGKNYGICKNTSTNDSDMQCLLSGTSFQCIVDSDGTKMDCVTDSSRKIFCPVLNLTERIRNYTKIFNHYVATAGIDFDVVREKETAGNEKVRESYLFLKYYNYFRNAKECQYWYYLNINSSFNVYFDFKWIFAFLIVLF